MFLLALFMLLQLSLVNACSELTYPLPDLSLVGKKPYFSWDYTPVFWHAGSPSGLTDSQVNFLATHPFSTITIEKFESMAAEPVGAKEEEKIYNVSLKIRDVNPHAQVIFYQNSAVDFPNYQLYCKTFNQDLVVKNFVFKFTGGKFYGINCKTGNVTTSTNMKILDFSKSNMLNVWKQHLLKIKNYKFAGIFLDRAVYTADNLPLTKNQKMTWNKNHDEALNMASKYFPIVIANNRNMVNNYGPMGRMIERFYMRPNGLFLEQSIKTVINSAKNGRILHVHVDGCGPDTGTDSQIRNRIVGLAGFLIGACKYSYFACNNRFTVDDLDSYQMCWYPEYNKKLGYPLGAAKKVTDLAKVVYFYRKFSEDVEVFVDTLSNACICWGPQGSNNPLETQRSSCYGDYTCETMKNVWSTMYNGSFVLEPDNCKL